MATAIREIELSVPVTPLAALAGYERCMLVFRWHGRIVGRQFVPVTDSRIERAAVAEAVRACGAAPLQHWLEWSLGYRDQAVGPALTATVAICTRERPDDLDRALGCVTQLADEPREILVVDNAPATDRTAAVVARYPGVRYVLETRRGLNAARNRALLEAGGDIVAFTDDDAAPEPEWLGALLANFGDPGVQCVTGLTLPIELETDAQELFERHCPFARGFRRRLFDGQHDNPLAVGPVGAGANMAVRRSLVEIVGPFDERLDGGMPTRSGGDHEMFIRILSAGHRIVYDPAAVSWHRHRRTHDELVDTVFGYGVGVYAMWTGLLFERRELGVLKMAWAWFRAAHLPALAAAMKGRRDRETALALAEIRGCVHGPAAWMAANRLRPGHRTA